MSIIALVNQKGGVAKTTSTHNIAVALSKKGKKVLMLDLDSQASLTISTGLEPLDIKYNIVDILQKNGLPVQQCIQSLNDNLDIITSIIDLATIEMELISRPSRERILDRALSQVKDSYDYILIDCPPQLSILTINALSCADNVIIPVKTDYLAYRGLKQLIDTIREIQELINPNLNIMGIVATLFEKRINDDREILDALREEYNVIGVVKKMVAAKKGIYDGLSTVEQSPNNDIAKEYNKIADIIIGA